MITAQQAAAEAGRTQRAMNNSRYTPPMPKMFQKAADENRVFIFNVGPWEHIREMGSAGTSRIPACPEGKDYSEPLIVPGVVTEPYPINEAENKLMQEDGESFALQIIGEGPHVPHSSSFRPFGVFISRTPKPTKEELSTARGLLIKKYAELVGQANAAAADGPQRMREVIDPKYHHVAARALKKTVAECPWLANTETPAERAECPACGDVYKVGVMKCRGCGFILDKPRYDKAVKDGLFAA